VEKRHEPRVVLEILRGAARHAGSSLNRARRPPPGGLRPRLRERLQARHFGRGATCGSWVREAAVLDIHGVARYPEPFGRVGPRGHRHAPRRWGSEPGIRIRRGTDDPGSLIMGSVPVLKPREVIAILIRFGVAEVRQRGSHKQYRHADGRATTVPFHAGRDIAPTLLRSAGTDRRFAAPENPTPNRFRPANPRLSLQTGTVRGTPAPRVAAGSW
jgi:predicted RNA binding protein YcfA (HicA-like mRNA interferase family)